MKKSLLLPFLIAYIMLGCTSTGSDQQDQSTTTISDTSASLPVSDNEYEADSVSPTRRADEIPIEEYLIGRWQSLEDTSNIVVFDGNLRSEKSAGMKEWDREEFVLSDGCMNGSNKNSGEAKEKDRYISCLKSDMCWYIITLDKETLSLSYMGRGNTLNYRRMEDDM